MRSTMGKRVVCLSLDRRFKTRRELTRSNFNLATGLSGFISSFLPLLGSMDPLTPMIADESL